MSGRRRLVGRPLQVPGLLADPPGIPGDPTLKPHGIPGGGVSAIELSAIIAAGREKGMTPAAAFEAHRTAASNGVKVH